MRCPTGRGMLHGAQISSVKNGSWGNRSSARDRKSTRLNSSHSQISYAVFCLKKKKNHARCSSRCTSHRKPPTPSPVPRCPPHSRCLPISTPPSLLSTLLRLSITHSALYSGYL